MKNYKNIKSRESFISENYKSAKNETKIVESASISVDKIKEIFSKAMEMEPEQTLRYIRPHFKPYNREIMEFWISSDEGMEVYDKFINHIDHLDPEKVNDVTLDTPLEESVNELNVNDEDFGEDKKDDVAFDKGCVMLKVERTDAWNKILESIDEEDVYESEEEPNRFGVESDPHVTVLFGTHDSEIDKEEISKTITERDAISLKMVDISMFENEEFDVLKFGVESEDLVSFNKELTEKYPYSNDHDYTPHATIAYLKSGTGKKYIKEFTEEEVIEIEGLTEITYSRVEEDGKDKVKLSISPVEAEEEIEESVVNENRNILDLSEIRDIIRELDFFKDKMMAIEDEDEYTNTMMKVEEELGEDAGTILDKIVGSDLDYTSDYMHYNQNGMTGAEDTGEFMENIEDIKAYLKTV